MLSSSAVPTPGAIRLPVGELDCVVTISKPWQLGLVSARSWQIPLKLPCQDIGYVPAIKLFIPMHESIKLRP